MRRAAFLLAIASAAAAQERVTKVDVSLDGFRHTRASAVRRLMTTRGGDELDAGTLRGDLARLRATGILYDVQERTVAAPEGQRVEVSLKDRWSLLPVFGIRRGGGRTTSRIGFADHNAFGQLFSVYGELTSNADVPFYPQRPDDRIGSLLYVRVPRMFGTRVTPTVSWSRDFLAFSRFGAAPAAYERSRHELRFEARYELTDLLSASAGVAFDRDRYAHSALSKPPESLPDAGNTTWLIAGAQLGVVEEWISMLEGTQLEVTASRAQRGVLGSDATVTAVSAAIRSFSIVAPETNLALQITARASTGRSDSHLFRAGGLREIRGFPDAYFQARELVHGNLELRRDVARTTFLVDAVGQAAAFVDFGWVGQRVAAVAGAPYSGPVASAGVGLRWIPIPFARAVGRIDVAMGMVPERRVDVSLGGQQFF